MINKKSLITLLIFIFLTSFVFSVYSTDIVNIDSGSYNDDIFVSVDDISNTENIFYSFGEAEAEALPNIPYNGGLLLSAIPGEERSYNLNFLINNNLYNYKYIIDKKKPEPPETVFNEGYSFISNSSEELNIYYGYDDYKQGEVFLWSGEPLSAPNAGIIFYFAVDNAGNKSETRIINPFEQTSLPGKAALQIKSPAEGEFSNTQLLYIEKKGFEWIKYTLNGLDPKVSGAEYNEPVEIRRYGNVILKVAAKPIFSDKLITKEIIYRVNTRAPIKNIPSSGIYSGSINIKSNLNNYRYCLEDRVPNLDDPLFNSELTINPVYGGVKYTTLRINNPEEVTDADFRYFYIIDDRLPANPIIECSSRLPAENVIDVTIAGPEYSDIYYTVDGSTPGKSSKKYSNTFSLDVPDNKNAGSLIIKARAVSLNGKPGNIVSKFFTYDTKKPEIPEVKIIFNEESGLYELDYNIEPGEILYYKLTDADSDFAKINKDNFFLDMPEGSFRKFDFVFSSVDSAGNWSDLSEPLSIVIDKRYPEQPQINFNENILEINSIYYISYFYELIYNDRILDTGISEYTEPVDFSDKVIPGSVLKLIVTSSDDLGNKINKFITFNTPLDKIDKEAVLFSRKSEDIYSGSEVSFFAYPDGIDDKLYYYLTDETNGDDNKTTGPFETDGYISIAGTENEKKEYYLEVFSLNELTGEKSRVSSYNFTIDNEKPLIPQISGLKNNSVIGNKAILEPNGDDDSIVFLNFSNSADSLGEMFGDNSIIFNKPIVFDTKEHEVKDFYLKIGAGDSAGNSSINENIFHFTIDKKPPVINDIKIENGNLSISGEENTKYYYETGIKGSRIEEPDFSSQYFQDELNIENKSGYETSYIIKILAVDEAGNKAKYPISLMYSIDNKKPDVNEAPIVNVDEKKKKIFVHWKDSEYSIFYKIKKNGSLLDEEWLEYRYPFSFKYSSDINQAEMLYYSEDSAGNKTEINTYTVALQGNSSTELAQGIKNNAFYNSDLELSPINPDSLIRYEITTDKLLPLDVTVFSPELPDLLPFKIEEGESINFIVSLKEFKNYDDKKGGAEQVLRFTIDKQHPEPPEIDGIKDGEYYLTDCIAFFKPTEDTVYYSINNQTLSNEDFMKYEEPFEIKSREGTYNSFNIHAYTEDYSGNKSNTKSWSITIDKEIIYVSENGKDYYQGTRSWPFRTLNKAIEQVKLSDRKTIFLEDGIYSLNSPAVIDEKITFYGGFKKGNWQEKSGTTTILLDKEFPEDNPGFYIYGGNLTIDNCKINTTVSHKSPGFLINKGNLNLSNCVVVNDSDDDSSLIVQNYGRLYINNSDISGQSKTEPFINCNYGQIAITKSSLTVSSDAADSFIINAENCSDFDVSSSKIIIAGGVNATALKLVNTNADIRNTELISTGCEASSTAAYVVDSKLSVKYSRFVSSDENRISRSIITEDSTLNIDNNHFEVDSKSGIIVFNLTGGENKFYNNRVNTGECNDFSYLFLLNGGFHSIETNQFEIKGADEIVSIRSKNASLDYLNNTFSTTGGKINTIMFKAEGKSVNRIINNIIIRNTESGTDALIYKMSEDSMISFKNNCVYGWNNYINGIEHAEDLISLDLVDGIYSAGRYSGNIEESPDKTFIAGFKLSPESRCIDSGYDVKNILSRNSDMEGDLRPNKVLNTSAAYDIGADEYYK